MTKFLQHLKQRKLVQWTVAYVAAAFALLQSLDIVAQRFAWPDSVERGLIIAACVGLFVVLVLAWYHGERGAQKVSGTELLLLALVLAIGGGVLWRFAAAPRGGVPAADAAAPARADAPTTRTSAATATPDKSIAVLPFVNLSGDPKNEYLSDGITEEILNALAQIPQLKVAARTSAFAFKGRAADLRAVGETLGVATVLEGSVQNAGDQVRINAQLVDARSGFQLWSAKYDRKLTSVFAIEDEISHAIADRLRAQWSGDQPLVRSGTHDAQAHSLYLQALGAIAARGGALRQAATLLGQATARDPEYAAAWAQLSQVQELLPWYELAPWDASLDDAERSARHALALDAQSAEAHAALANVLRDRFVFAEAGRQYRRSLELNPGLSEVHNQYAQLLDAVGRIDAAIAQERIAIAQDPLAPNPQYMLGLMLDSRRRHDEASAVLENVIRIAPHFAYSRDQLAFSRIYAGDYARAQDVAGTAAEAVPDRREEDRQVVATLIAAVAEPARRARALPLVSGLHRIGHANLGGLARAFWYSLLGAREQALRELQQWSQTAAQGQRFNGLRFLWMPAFDPIREDPRFKALLAGFGLPDLSVDALRAGGARADDATGP